MKTPQDVIMGRMVLMQLGQSPNALLAVVPYKALRSSAPTGHNARAKGLEVWPESHWQGFALRQPDVSRSYLA